jgi:hypothetical protein
VFYQQEIFLGVDTAGGKHPYHVAVINRSGELLALSQCKLEEVIKYTSGDVLQLAVNAPRSLPAATEQQEFSGLHQWENSLGEKQESFFQPPGYFQTGLRSGEAVLKRMKVRFQSTSMDAGQTSARVRNGMRLYRQLEHLGELAESGRVIEESSPATFALLIEGRLLPASSFEGRIQRQLVLINQGLRLRDPMGFYEEVTRRKLLMGQLEDAMLYSPLQLDALVAALIARLAAMEPQKVEFIGDDVDGWIAIPRRMGLAPI